MSGAVDIAGFGGFGFDGNGGLLEEAGFCNGAMGVDRSIDTGCRIVGGAK